jgi:ribonucleoside-diphosphate reductase alpha chain
MTAVDHAFMAGFHAALDLAERTGAAILAGQWGHPVRREHAAAGLLHFADAAREALTAEGVRVTRMASPEGMTVMVMPSIEGEAVAARSSMPEAPMHNFVQTPFSKIGEAPLQNSVEAPSADLRSRAVSLGYVGEACPECANFTLVRNGTCLKCDTCGSTTGCS